MISTQFLQSCMSGDEQAITTLVRTHQRGVFQLALSILDDAETPPGVGIAGANNEPSPVVQQAEIVTRQTFITAIDRLGRYREETPFETWLYGITIKLAVQRYRRWKTQRWWGGLFRRLMPRPVWHSGLKASGASPAAVYLQPSDIELWSAVRRLEEKLRVPVVLRYYHDFPIHEIAKMLRLSEGAVHARLDSARERLAGREKKAEPPDPT